MRLPMMNAHFLLVCFFLLFAHSNAALARGDIPANDYLTEILAKSGLSNDERKRVNYITAYYRAEDPGLSKTDAISMALQRVESIDRDIVRQVLGLLYGMELEGPGIQEENQNGGNSKKKISFMMEFKAQGEPKLAAQIDPDKDIRWFMPDITGELGTAGLVYEGMGVSHPKDSHAFERDSFDIGILFGFKLKF